MLPISSIGGYLASVTLASDSSTTNDEENGTSKLKSLKTVGTTEQVRVGLSQTDKVILIGAIKASYNRVGLDTQEHEESLTKTRDYATPEQKQAD